MDCECAQDISDVVVRVKCPRRSQVISACIGAGGARDNRQLVAQAGCGITIHQARIAEREGRKNITIRDGWAIGGHRERGRSDGQTGGDVIEAVVRVNRTRGRNFVAARIAAGGHGAEGGGCGQVTRGFAIHEPSQAVSESWQRPAVGHRLRINGDREGSLGNGEGATDIVEGVIVGCTATGGHGVSARPATGRRRAWDGQRGEIGNRITIH